MIRSLTVGAALVLSACSRAQDSAQRTADSSTAPGTTNPGAPASATGTDTLRGQLSLTATASDTGVTMRAGDTVYTLRTTEQEPLRRVSGLEVVVRGRHAGPRVFDVANFAVRASNGVPAVDGILDVENGIFFLRLADGSRANIAITPVPLRGEIGSRVYLVGPLTGAVTGFGVIKDP